MISEESSTKSERQNHSVRILCFTDWLLVEVSNYVSNIWNFL
jgi:hypothetical protein